MVGFDGGEDMAMPILSIKQYSEIIQTIWYFRDGKTPHRTCIHYQMYGYYRYKGWNKDFICQFCTLEMQIAMLLCVVWSSTILISKLNTIFWAMVFDYMIVSSNLILNLRNWVFII